MSMTKSVLNSPRLILITALVLTGCNKDLGSNELGSNGNDVHQEMQIVDPSAHGSSQGSGMSVSTMSATFGHRSIRAAGLGFVSAQAVSIGSVYLETQLPPLTVTGTPLQATDVAAFGTNAYVTYSSVDTGGMVVKKGAVSHVSALSCDNPLTARTEYCLGAGTSLLFPTTDIFAAYTDGVSLWTAGSTLAEDQAPKYARLYKVTLDTSMNPSAIAVTQALTSYAGTGITKVGSNLLVTSGTSTTVAIQGGLNVVNAATLVPSASQNYYDARAVAADPTNSGRAFVVRGAVDTTNKGAVAEFAVDGLSTAVREIATGGNNIPESKSSVLAGKTLLLTSMGDQGFRVSCKGTGASLATVPAPVVSGIPTNLTVTNSVTALPGYILAANGEAGVYLYSFQKSSLLNSTYCQGVTLTLIGRLSLAGSSTYVNGELSANSVKYVPIIDVLGLLTSKLVVIASGNKGVSLLNLSGLTLSGLIDVDDF